MRQRSPPTTPVYLDYHATAPHDPEVIARMRPCLEAHFGNSSSAHPYGAKAREAVETARAQVAALPGCRPKEILFTSGGTESNNHAIRGAAFWPRDRGNHIVTSEVGHPTVLEVCRNLDKHGFETAAAVARAVAKILGAAPFTISADA